jgi:hypothetical protein
MGDVGTQLEVILTGLGIKFLITFLLGTIIFWALVIWSMKSIGSKLTLLIAVLWVVGLPLFFLLKIPVMFHLVYTAVAAIFIVIQLKYYGEV